jgi:hypothetical protein
VSKTEPNKNIRPQVLELEFLESMLASSLDFNLERTTRGKVFYDQVSLVPSIAALPG